MELVAEPDEKEIELRKSLDNDPSVKPDLQQMFDLASHLIDKNRPDEAIKLLLDVIAIDRNWNERKAQTMLTDLFKKLGSSNEMVKEGRKTLSKLLF